MSENEESQAGGLEELDVVMTPVSPETEVRVALEQVDVPPVVDPFEAATEEAAAEAAVPVADRLEESQDPELDIWEDFHTPNKHVTMNTPVQRAADLSRTKTALAGLKIGLDEANAILNHENLDDITEEQAKTLTLAQRRLINVIQQLSAIWQTAYFKESFKEGDWQQTVKHNDTDLSTRRMKMERVNDPILQIRNSLGQGTLVQIPLWHTGIWITLRAPSNGALLDLDQRIRMEKSTLGRQTNGMVFSNTEIYTVATYARFVLDHMHSVTYKFETNEPVNELLGIIRSTDYPQLMYGLLSAMYPDGYPFRQPCVADPHKCDHVDETILSIARLSWVDRDRLTAKQKRLMASRDAQRTLAEIADYQSDFPFDNRAIKLNKSITAYMCVPTLQQQIDSGYRWVDGIADATNKAFGVKLSEVDRYRHIMRAGLMTSLRQYSHWFDRIEIQEKDGIDPTVVSDPVKKDEALEVISGDPRAVSLLDDSILKWIDNCSISIIGLPKSHCPKCQKAPDPELSAHPHLIPLDVGYVFFTLAAQRLEVIEDAAEQ